MGYFPTPLSLIEALASQLRAPAGQPFRWLDPCAGEGIALSMLAERRGGETFGIELDTERAAEAKARLQHVLEGDFADMRLPVNQPGISVLFLNAPYDDDDSAGRRLELHFLLLIYSLCTPYTQC